jgi:hypothetical protein
VRQTVRHRPTAGARASPVIHGSAPPVSCGKADNAGEADEHSPPPKQRFWRSGRVLPGCLKSCRPVQESGKRGEGSIGRGHRQVHLPLLTQTLVPRRLLYSVGQAGHHVYQQRVPWRVALEPLASVIFAAPSTRENGAGDRRMGPRWHLRSGSH